MPNILNKLPLRRQRRLLDAEVAIIKSGASERPPRAAWQWERARDSVASATHPGPFFYFRWCLACLVYSQALQSEEFLDFI